MNEICVSVFMLAYNQEEFISQAIEGVLMQQTDFTYQLVIGEDFSTDRTREICQAYARDNPHKIKPLFNEKNIGLGANYVKTYQECTGKYVAICDGDDYWTDQFKLQKQVDFLKKHPDYKIIYTSKYDLFPSGKFIAPTNNGQPLTTGFSDLVNGNYIPSVTVLFKNESLTADMKNWIPDFPYGDWPTYLNILADGGKIFYLDEPTAVYRKDFGTSTKLRKAKSTMGKVNLAILRNILRDKRFYKKQEAIKAGIFKYKVGLMGSYNKEKRFGRAFSLLVNLSFYNSPFNIFRRYSSSLKESFLKK